MGYFLIRRLAGAFLVLALVSLLSFALIWLVPGDPAAAFLDASATPEPVSYTPLDVYKRQDLCLPAPQGRDLP